MAFRYKHWIFITHRSLLEREKWYKSNKKIAYRRREWKANKQNKKKSSLKHGGKHKELKIIKVTNNIVIFNLNKHLFEIIFKYDIYAKNITVNNQEYLWPDYIKINRKILNTVLDDKLCVTNYNQIYNNTFILEMILGACNE